MITRVFRLTEASAKYIGRLPKENAILVVKSEHKVRHLFIDALEVALYQRGDTKPAFAAIGDYFKGMVSDQAFREKIDAELQALRHYVDEGVVYRPAFETIRDYVLGKCARMCAETVHAVVGGTFVDGAEVMVCEEDHGALRVDWNTSMTRLNERTAKPGLYVMSSGYGHNPYGFSIRLGRRGEDLMAMTIAAHFGEPAEVYVLGDRILGIPAMTYEEAAVFCSGTDGAFAPAALLPMMKAGLPILVKDVADPSCLTVISGSKPASDHVVTGFVVEDGFALINVRGTGLVGKVGVSSSIFGALARGGVNIRFISQLPFTEPVRFGHRLDDSIVVLKLIPGTKPELVEYLFGHYDCLVIESFGVGGIPDKLRKVFYQQMEHWISRGKVVVIATQVANEGSNMEVYEVGQQVKQDFHLMEAYDMTLEATITKLMYLMGTYGRDYVSICDGFYKTINYDILMPSVQQR